MGLEVRLGKLSAGAAIEEALGYCIIVKHFPLSSELSMLTLL
jgi:hypothetical protein